MAQSQPNQARTVATADELAESPSAIISVILPRLKLTGLRYSQFPDNPAAWVTGAMQRVRKVKRALADYNKTVEAPSATDPYLNRGTAWRH